MLRNRIYYIVRPLLLRWLQLFIRRGYIRLIAHRYSDVWPIDPDSARVPENWPGWPNGKRFAFVLTHDVDTSRGYDRVKNLADIEMGVGFRSSFNFVARRYEVDTGDFKYLTDRGFEIGVHGVYHDGKLFNSYEKFSERARIINECLARWGAVGFRAPAMHRNLDWIHDLDIEYDMSTFDTDPFEPQSDGIGTIFPFWINGNGDRSGYVELPYTLTQDFTSFILMRHRTNDLWKKKLDWVVEKGGMVLINSHPDYMCFGENRPGMEEYPVSLYSQLLEYVLGSYAGDYWHALPREVARFVKSSRDEKNENG